MALIEKFLYSVIDEDDAKALFRVKDKFLLPKEQKYLSFVQDFYALYSKLPEVQTVEDKFGIKLIRNTESATYWYNEIYNAYQTSIVEDAIITSAKNKKSAIDIFQQAIIDYNSDADIQIHNYTDGANRLKSYRERKGTNGISYLSTGMPELDVMSLGYKKADLWTIGGSEGMGKAQPLDAKILTPKGFVTMGSLKIGDTIMTSDGYTQKVTGIFPQGLRKIVELVFQDDNGELSYTRCDYNHLWSCATYKEMSRGKYSVRTTRHMIELTKQTSIYIPEYNKCNFYKRRLFQVNFIDEPVECQCISVSSKNKLYVTDDYIVTHNTWFLLKMANALDTWTLNNNINRKILIVSGEMTAEELEERLDAIRCHISYSRLSSGNLTAIEERKYERYLNGFESNIILVDSFDNINDVEYFISLYRPCCIFIDGSHLLSSSYEWKDISQVTKKMKTLTRNNKVPIINTTHLKADKGNSASGGSLDDFAYTKGYTRDSDIVGVMYASDIMVLDNQIGIDWVKVRRGDKYRAIWESDYDTCTTKLVENLTGKALASAKVGDDNSISATYTPRNNKQIY